MSLSHLHSAVVAFAISCFSTSVVAIEINFQNLNGAAELEGVGETYSAKGYTFTYTAAPEEPYPTYLFSVGPNWQYNKVQQH